MNQELLKHLREAWRLAREEDEDDTQGVFDAHLQQAKEDVDADPEGENVDENDE